MRTATDILLRKKICLALIFLINPSEEKKTASFIAKKADITFGHIHNIIGKLIKNDILESEKKGRMVELEFTTKGYTFAQKIRELYYKLEEAR